MNDVLLMSIQNNGIYSSLPHIFELLVALTIGFLSDWIARKNYLSTTNSRKFFATSGERPSNDSQNWNANAHFIHSISASLLGALFFLATSFAGCNKVMVVLFLSLVAGSQSLKTPGTSVNIFDLAPNYVSILAGIVNGIGSFTGILVPYIIGLMTPNVCTKPAQHSERTHTPRIADVYSFLFCFADSFTRMA